MNNDDKKFFGLCIVVEDKVEDKFEIKVLPVSYVPDMKSEINKNTNGMLNLVDSSNFHSAIASTSSDHIEATWLPNGEQNRISAPDVCKGDIVEVYKVHGVDEYYWQVFAHNQGLRKKEKVLIWFSNKSTIGPNREADSYYLLVDTINKIVHFHTSDNDGEACTYDIVLNTLVGKFMLKDNLNNDILLDSPKGILTTNVVNEYNVNTKKINFNCNEFTLNAKLTKINSTITQFSGNEISHDGKDISKSHYHRQTNGNHFGGDTDTETPNNA